MPRRHVYNTGPDVVTHDTGALDTPQIENPAGDVILKFAGTVSGTAVNQLTVTAAATGASPVLSASGTDSNVSMNLAGKGTGIVRTATVPVRTAPVTILGAVAGQTITAAQCLTGLITHAVTGANTDTLPTAAPMVAALPGAKVGDSIEFVIKNNQGTNILTVAAGSGGAGFASDTLTIAVSSQRRFLIVLTNVTPSSEAYVLYSLGVALN